MFENVLKYLQPTHYFQLKTKSESYIFPVAELLSENIKSELLPDSNYKSEQAKAYDLSWQAIQKGYFGSAPTYSEFEQIPTIDDYRFARKNFSAYWVFYMLLLRLIALNNPVKEIVSCIKTRSIKRSHSIHSPIKSNWHSFDSELLKKEPLVSIIIPTLNRYQVLRDVLNDLEQQDYANFEVIIVDQSEPFESEFYKPFDLNINLIHQKEKALWLARNTAIRACQGDLVALSEDDVRIGKNWISEHLKCLDFFNAEVSAGVFHPEGQAIPKDRSYFKLASHFATGNAMLYKTVFKEIGLFDRQFEKQRMGDGEFGMRIYLNGIKSLSNPYASCIDVKAATGGLRFMGSWDAFRPTSIFAPRPVPSVLYFFRSYFGNKNARLSLLRTIPLSIMPYRFKKNKLALIVGVFISILLLPLVIIQVFRSWNLATQKIKQGPLIEQLN